MLALQGVEKLIASLQARGIAVYLISGGFRWEASCLCCVMSVLHQDLSDLLMCSPCARHVPSFQPW
jgi:hypothetical protein